MSADKSLLCQRELAIPLPAVAGEISHERVPRDDGSEIELDAYYPATSPTARNPAVVIASGYRDTGFEAAVGCRFKDMGWTKSWVRLFVSSGIAAFVYSPRDVEADFATIVSAVAAHTRVNSSRVGVFASSGHATIALTSIMRQLPVAVSCVSLLYGYTLDLAGESRVAAAAKMFKFENGCAERSLAEVEHVEWQTTYRENDETYRYKISAERGNLKRWTISDPEKVNARGTGTIVEISALTRNYTSLEGDVARQAVAEEFALYLRQYPDVTIHYDRRDIDPAAVEILVRDYDLPVVEHDGARIAAGLTVIEWRTSTERALYLCDDKGFTLGHVAPGIQAPGFQFTAYLKTDYFRELDARGDLRLEELHPGVKRLLDTAKLQMKEHFRQRASEAAVDLVKEWKKEKVYPYEGEPASVVEEVERQVFDVVALNVNSYVPDFSESEQKSKRFFFQLLRETLETRPSAVQRIFQQVLDLPDEKQVELDELLKKTTLEGVINASKIVTDRLDFLRGLELLLFEEPHRSALLERRELQEMLVDHTWIFAEEYHLTIDDESLDQVLFKHLELLDRKADDLQPVLREDGSTGRIDMMLSRRIPLPKQDERHHLVVELKRPTVKIDSKAASQVKGYALAVSADERFIDTNTKWTFWAVSNVVTDEVQIEASQPNRPQGIILENEKRRLQVWVKSWGQVIEECRGRLRFFQERLNYLSSKGSALAYLRATHAKYLPDTLSAAAVGDDVD